MVTKVVLVAPVIAFELATVNPDDVDLCHCIEVKVPVTLAVNVIF